MNLTTLERKLDRQAIHQLRAEVVRLAAELERAEQARWIAEDAANYWEENCRALQEQVSDIPGADLGMTINGDLVVVRG